MLIVRSRNHAAALRRLSEVPRFSTRRIRLDCRPYSCSLADWQFEWKYSTLLFPKPTASAIVFLFCIESPKQFVMLYMARRHAYGRREATEQAPCQPGYQRLFPADPRWSSTVLRQSPAAIGVRRFAADLTNPCQSRDNRQPALDTVASTRFKGRGERIWGWQMNLATTTIQSALGST